MESPAVVADSQDVRSIVVNGRAIAFVLPSRRGNHRMNAVHHAAGEIAVAKSRTDFFIDDPLADRIRQSAFQAVSDLNEHLVRLDENEQDCTVIQPLAADFPLIGDANCVIVDR